MARTRGWCFTVNNYTEEERLAILGTECRYIIVGQEVGLEGTPHLQGFVYFEQPKALRQVRLICPRGHWENARGSPQQNIAYCSKEGRFETRGEPPASQEEKGEKGKAAIAARWKAAKEGKFEELPPEAIKTYQYIHAKYGNKVEDRTELVNIWITGQSGCGKSRWVRDNHPVFYSKPMSKWWDGYANEDVVLLDDFDPTHGKFLAYFLKIWADHYVFNAEVKGGMLRIRPKTVIVTSQYTIDQCFESQEDKDAISRRFAQKNVILDMFGARSLINSREQNDA
nr:MAG: replication associated protein [Cressdnaviricota sp.]